MPASVKGRDDACTAEFIRQHGRMLFRRPLTAQEVEPRVAVASAGAEQAQDYYAGLKLALPEPRSPRPNSCFASKLRKSNAGSQNASFGSTATPRPRGSRICCGTRRQTRSCWRPPPAARFTPRTGLEEASRSRCSRRRDWKTVRGPSSPTCCSSTCTTRSPRMPMIYPEVQPGRRGCRPRNRR